MNGVKKLACGFVLSAAVALCAASASATTWTYSGGTITDGDWTLNCTYTVGQSSITIGAVATTAASGILDLREMSVTDGTTAASITRIGFNANWDNGVAIKALYADCAASLPRLMQNTTLETVVVANPQLTSIPGYVFWGCSKLTSDIAGIVTPEATSIGQNAFNGSGVTGKLTLTNVTTMASGSFQNTKIVDVEIVSDTLTAIGGAFYQCAELTNATITCKNLTELTGTFGFCGAKLKTVLLNCPKLATIGADTFKNDSLSVDVSYVCPPSVMSIGNYAFSGTSVTGILVLTNLTSIGTSAFHSSGLQEIEIAGPLETIQGFYYNRGLTNATFNCPNATIIAAQSFQYSSALKSFTIKCPALTSIGANSFGNIGAPMTLSIMNQPWKSANTDYTATILDGFLVRQGAVSSASYSVIYADKREWSGYALAFTDAEKVYKPEKAYGTYASAGDVRKAFFVNPIWAKTAGLSVHFF